MEARIGDRPRGPIRLLTCPRSFGLLFNPASFYYCFDSTGHVLETLVVEVTNTPWGETHYYVLPIAEIDSTAAGDRGTQEPSVCEKAFHVSPFMGMKQEYRWSASTPGDSLALRVASHEEGRRLFEVGLSLSRIEMSRATLASAFRAHPLISWRIMAGIYWQALRLFGLRVPFVSHPETHWPKTTSDLRHFESREDSR